MRKRRAGARRARLDAACATVRGSVSEEHVILAQRARLGAAVNDIRRRARTRRFVQRLLRQMDRAADRLPCRAGRGVRHQQRVRVIRGDFFLARTRRERRRRGEGGGRRRERDDDFLHDETP